MDGMQVRMAQCYDDSSLDDWWRSARQGSQKTLRKGPSIALLASWQSGKHCNAFVFNRTQPFVHNAVNSIINEAALWARAAAKGLRVVLPITWNAH
jgi:hypothetical protein